MVAFLSDDVLDSGLNFIYNLSPTNIEIYINYTQQPANYTEATSTYACGSTAASTNPSCGAPTNGDSSGRKVVIAAVTDGDVTSTQTAGWFSLVKSSATTQLLAANALNSTQAVTNLNKFTLTSWSVTIPDPTA